jgi:tetratricopeptide (TPR) repeat protein
VRRASETVGDWEAELARLADPADGGQDLAAVVATARAAIRQDPSRPAPLFWLCCLLLRQRDGEAAALLPRLEAFVGYAPGWQALGGTLLAAGRTEAARVAFQRAVNAAPHGIRGQLGLAASLLDLGRPAEAAALLEQAERHAPDAAVLPYRRGVCLRASGDTAAACAALLRAVQLDARIAGAWFALGLVRHDLGDYRGAAEAYRAALGTQPDMHEAAVNLGNSLQYAGDLEAALDAYAVAFRLHPTALGRIAQAVVAAPTGRLWLDVEAFRSMLGTRM